MYSKKEIENLFTKILIEISQKGKPLRNILKRKDMPDGNTFYKWLNNDDKKVEQYARACDERAEMMFEDMLEIADDQENDVYIDENGKEITNYNVIHRSRLRVDTRKWALSKLNPKKYSDRQIVDQNTTLELKNFKIKDVLKFDKK